MITQNSLRSRFTRTFATHGKTAVFTSLTLITIKLQLKLFACSCELLELSIFLKYVTNGCATKHKQEEQTRIL